VSTDKDFWANLSKTLRSMVAGDSSSVVVNAESGMVMVHGRPGELQAVTQYLQALSGTPRAAGQER
jgi:hypothetical protein